MGRPELETSFTGSADMPWSADKPATVMIGPFAPLCSFSSSFYLLLPESVSVMSEAGLDGWHVCGVNNQLFYSKDPFPASQNRGRDHWTEDMHSAHAEVSFRLGLVLSG